MIITEDRPEIVKGTTYKLKTGCGSIYITINENNNDIYEIFASIGKSGACINSFIESIGRLISIALKAGIKPKTIIKQIENVRCPSPTWFNNKEILSCSDAIGKAMKEHLEAKKEK